MRLDYSLKSKVRIMMTPYIKEIVDLFRKYDDTDKTAATPAAEHLFKVDGNTTQLSIPLATAFHHFVTKCLFATKRARPDISTAVAFLTTRVKGPDEDNILKSSFGKFKGEKNTDFFAEIYKPGNVSLLKFFIPPTLTDEDFDDAELMKKHAEESKTSFDILITRPGEKPKSIDDISIKGFFKDCPFVVDKYTNGKYKIKPGKSLKAMFKSEKLPGIKMEEAANDILSDYETHCTK